MELKRKEMKKNNVEWRAVVGFPNYEVSNWGSVRRTGAIQPLQLCRQSRGYYQVYLCQGGKVYPKLVHRLVGEAFIPNPHHKPQINHLDEVKTNNNVTNLNWVTASENCLYGTKPKKMRDANRKMIIAINPITMQVKAFETLSDCTEYFNIDYIKLNGILRNNSHGDLPFICVEAPDGESWILNAVTSSINADGELVYTAPSERKRRELIAEFNRLSAELEPIKADNEYHRAMIPNIEAIERMRDIGRILSNG